MSTTIDSRVVEMRFDNKQFEKNVSTTMSTLEKLKQKLNLTGTSKGFDNLNASVKRTDLSPVGNAAETVGLKFNAMFTIADQALRNITNSAMATGKKIVSALTIDPVKTGLSEYETKINAIQVIQANTRGKNDMNDITTALEDLNTYADKTIYNFAQMTNNIGKFTAQGLDVYEAADAVKGMANLAAASGASAEDMARATYQMSQALSGTIKLMDWNSLRNANMATVELKNTLIDLAKVNGIAIDDMIAEYGTFEQTLSEGWLTGEMFSKAMNIYSGVYEDAELAAMGFTESQIANFKDLAAMAESAATEVKTFTQLWDVLKETAQSGWTQTWELLIGDFDTAKTMLTNLQNYFSNIINGWADIRNTLLGGALNIKNPWDAILKKLDKAGLGKIKEMAESVSNVTDKLEHFQDVVSKVWRGDFGNADTGRFEMLEKAGYDHRVIQDLVNKGLDYKLTIEDVEASHKKFGLTMQGTSEDAKGVTDALSNLSDEELRNAGLTEGEIRLYRALAEESKKTGKSISELVDEMSKADGRTMLIESFKNAWSGLVSVFKAVKDAWSEVFPPITVVQLYNAIKGINEFSKHLVVSEETADKLRRTFKGVFAILDIVFTLVGGPLKIAFKALSTILGMFDMDILDLTAGIGDAIVAFRDWIDENNIFIKGLEKIIPFIKKVVKAIGDWVDELKDVDNVPKYIIQGLVNGLRSGITETVNCVIELGKSIITGIKKVLGIHSPSKEFFEIGKYTIQGFINGITSGISKAWDVIKNFFGGIIDFVKNIDLGQILAVGFSVGILTAIVKIAKAFENFSSSLLGMGRMFEGVSDMFEGLGAAFRADAMKTRSEAMLNMAKAIGILVIAIAGLTLLDTGEVWKAIGAIAALAAILALLSIAINKMGAETFGIKFSIQASGILKIGASLLLLAFAMKQLAKIEAKDIPGIIGTLTIAVVALSVLMVAFGKVVDGKETKYLGKSAKVFTKISIALLLMIGVIKLASTLDRGEIIRGAGAIAAMELLMLGIAVIARISGSNASKAGSLMLKVSFALVVMIGVIKLASQLNRNEIKAAISVIGTIGLVFAALVAATAIAGKNASKAGSLLLKASVALLIAVGVIKLASNLEGDKLKNGLVVIATLGIVFTALIGISALAGAHAKKAGSMLIMMSAALLVMTGVIFLLGSMNPDDLARGTTVVTVLGIIFIALIGLGSKIKGESKLVGALVTMTIALSVLIGAVALLTYLDPQKVANGAIAITGIILAFTALMGISKFAGNAKTILPTVLLMGLVLAELALVLGLMSVLNIQPSIDTAIALSTLLLALTASVAILSVFGAGAAVGALGGVAAMAILIAGVGLILLALAGLNALFPDLASFLDTGIPLLEKIGYAIGSFLGSIVGGFSAGATSGLPEVGKHLSDFMTNAQPFLTGVQAIDGGAVLAGVGSLAAAVIALTAADLIAGIASFIQGGSSFATLGAELSAFMINAMPFITGASLLNEDALNGVRALAETILILTGAGILDGIAALLGAEDSLKKFSEQLPLLGTGLAGFVTAITDVKLDGVGPAADAIKTLALVAQEIPNTGGLLADIVGDNDMAEWANKLGDLGGGLADFVTAITDVELDGVDAAADALKSLAQVAQEIPNTGGLLADIVGDNDMSDWADQLGDLGEGLADFVSKIDGVTLDSVGPAANAIKTLAKVAQEIPNTGGLLGMIVGNNDMGDWADQLDDLGEGLADFAGSLDGVTLDSVGPAANAIKTLAKVAQEIPNTGGLLGAIVGNNDMGEWGTELGDLGSGLATFVKNLDGAKLDVVDPAADAIEKLAETSENIPDPVGWFDKLCGEGSISEFASYLPGIGSNLGKFVNNIGSFNITIVETAVNALEEIVEAGETISEGGWFSDNEDIINFGNQIVFLGGVLKGFATELTGVDYTVFLNASVAMNNIAKILTIDTRSLPNQGSDLEAFSESFKTSCANITAIKVEDLNILRSRVNNLVSMINGIGDVDTSGVKAFSGSLKILGDEIKNFNNATANVKAVGTEIIDNIVAGLNSKKTAVVETASKIVDETVRKMDNLSPKFRKSGVDLMDDFNKGMDSKAKGVEKTANKIVSSVVDKMDDGSSKAYSAGSDVVDGFRSGISENSFKAEATAVAMAEAALEAAREALGINSPSKEFYDVGDFSGQGFINALSDYGSKAFRAGTEMAESAKIGLSNAVSKIRDYINGEMDTQPTIRPVLDLSDIRDGAGSIQSIFAGGTVGLRGNVDAISATMSQNGGESEVVSAINKLRKDLHGNIGNTTYTVNGITYDDGSNISNAVKDIVRAAKIGRRV